MQSAQEYWDGVEDVDVIELPEGEASTGKAKQRLTAERLDVLAVFFATPDVIRETWRGPKDYRELALLIGCKLRNLPRWKRHPMMVKRTAEILHAAAVYAMPNILWSQILAASPVVEVDEATGKQTVIPGDTKPANFVATIGKFIRSGMTISQTNVSPVTETHKEMTQEEFEKRMSTMFESADDRG